MSGGHITPVRQQQQQQHPILVVLGSPFIGECVDLIDQKNNECATCRSRCDIHSFADYTLSVDCNFLNKYGLDANGAVLIDSQNEQLLLPIFDQLHTMENLHVGLGGSALNTARVFQWKTMMNGQNGDRKKLKNGVAFFGAIGTDDQANNVMATEISQLKAIDMRLQQINGKPSAKCLVLINGENRSLCTFPGAANSFTRDFLEQPENMRIIENAQFFYTIAYFLTVCPGAVMHLAEHAARHPKGLFALNLSAPYIASKFARQLDALLAYVDILFGNEDEFIAYGSANRGFGGENGNVRAIALRLAKMKKLNKQRHRLLVITRGPEPVLVASSDGTIREFPVTPIDAADNGARRRIVDTNGAGDAFVGGFLASFVSCEEVAKCVEAGCVAARKICQQRGCCILQAEHEQL